MELAVSSIQHPSTDTPTESAECAVLATDTVVQDSVIHSSNPVTAADCMDTADVEASTSVQTEQEEFEPVHVVVENDLQVSVHAQDLDDIYNALRGRDNTGFGAALSLVGVYFASFAMLIPNWKAMFSNDSQQIFFFGTFHKPITRCGLWQCCIGASCFWTQSCGPDCLAQEDDHGARGDIEDDYDAHDDPMVTASAIAIPQTNVHVTLLMIIAIGFGLLGVCGFFSRTSCRYAVASALASTAATGASVVALTDFNFLAHPGATTIQFDPSAGIYLTTISAIMFACSSIAFIVGRTSLRANNNDKQSRTVNDMGDLSVGLSSDMSDLPATLLGNTNGDSTVTATSLTHATPVPVADAVAEAETIEVATDAAGLSPGMGWWHGFLGSPHLKCFILSTVVWGGLSSLFWCLASGAAQVGPDDQVCDFKHDLHDWDSWEYQYYGYAVLIFYLVEACSSSSAQYLCNVEETETVYEFVDRIRDNRPSIWWHVQCYHYETYTVTEYYTDSDGRQQSRTRTETRRVDTHSARGFYYVRILHPTGL